MTESPEIAETGVIHGRFQVLHNDHLRYLMAGKRLCRHLVVGITNPDPHTTKAETADPRRSDPTANPLTYFERYRMVTAVLRNAGLDGDDFSVVPFPINYPERYPYYVPMDALFFLSIYDDWGRRKHNYFHDLDLKTHVLWEVSPDQKGISGADVRKRMTVGDLWEHLTPPPVPALMAEWAVAARLRKMM